MPMTNATVRKSEENFIQKAEELKASALQSRNVYASIFYPISKEFDIAKIKKKISEVFETDILFAAQDKSIAFVFATDSLDEALQSFQSECSEDHTLRSCLLRRSSCVIGALDRLDCQAA